jgi:hypothetical protein
VLEDGETVEDHGLMRLCDRGRSLRARAAGYPRWREGFMVITNRRLIWRGDNSQTISVWHPGVERHRGFSTFATADLFVHVTGVFLDGHGVVRRLRFKGGKTFVFLCSRALSQHRQP